MGNSTSPYIYRIISFNCCLFFLKANQLDEAEKKIPLSHKCYSSVHIFNLQEQCSVIFTSSNNNTSIYFKEKGENRYKQYHAVLIVAKFLWHAKEKKTSCRKKSNKKLTLKWCSLTSLELLKRAETITKDWTTSLENRWSVFPAKYWYRPLGKNEWVQLTEACTHQKVLVKTRQTKRKTTVTEVGIWFEDGFD